ncbi:MAG: heparan-alpha-glucosaminide N-acetyltransferase domain-containing protein [Vicinamibacterales bacterium]
MTQTPGPAGDAAPGRPTPAGVHAHRVIFVDLARCLAVVFMLYGHAVSALLAPAYRTGRWYEAWQFQRGLTSTLFLLLSGFAFSLATSRHWATHLSLTSPAGRRRLRRFAWFGLLGYALHYPVARLAQLPQATEAQWQAFLGVDVLQLIAVTFIGLQVLVPITRTVRWHAAVALLLAVGVIVLTPAVWRTGWTPGLPLGVAAYLSLATGSQFPLFPWSAYVLVGVAAGHAYGRWGAGHLATFAHRVLLGGGVILVAASMGLRPSAETLFGPGPWAWLPFDVLLRIGVGFLILWVLALASTRMTRLPHAFGAVAQESLPIYVVHLCIVYGSPWNRGLLRLFGPTLEPVPMLLVVVALLAAMILLASRWNWCKHAWPRTARAIGLVVGSVLFAMLLL